MVRALILARDFKERGANLGRADEEPHTPYFPVRLAKNTESGVELSGAFPLQLWHS